MVLKRMGWVFVLVLMWCLPPHAVFAEDSALVGTVAAFRIIEDTDGTEAFVPAEKAHPKDVIEYRLTYRNTSDAPITNVAIIDPVPAGMQFVPKSATDGEAVRAEYSIDHGATYHSWPVMRLVRTPDGRRIQRAATPDMITHIRWMVAQQLEPAKEITVTYRASVQ